MSTQKNPDEALLAWVDLEMTGINPANSHIIEVGLIVTDWQFNELAQYESVIYQPTEVLDKADQWVKDNMSGLLKLVPQGKPESQVEQEVIESIEEVVKPQVSLYLAGNSIHQDRRFIRKYWPQLEAKLHYRMLDVSAWKVVMSHKFGVTFKKGEEHRALADIRGSIQELKQYTDLIKSD